MTNPSPAGHEQGRSLPRFVIDEALPVIQAAPVQGQHPLGKRVWYRARRILALAGRQYALPRRCAEYEGYLAFRSDRILRSLLAAGRGPLEVAAR